MSIEQKLDESVKYIEAWLDYKFRHTQFPGMAVAISHKGKTIFSHAYGYANLEAKEVMTTDHIFRIASHSKTFTATALLQLQESGKLKLDDNVVEYLPWLKTHSDKRWQKVTIRQLLSHTAGVIRDGVDSDYWLLEKPFPDDEEFKKTILETELVFDTNTTQKYSNYGFTLLGMVITAVTGRPYNDYVKERIIDKLGLKNTFPEVEKTSTKYATGYSRQEPDSRLPMEVINTGSMSSATGFCSTVNDLCVYFTSHIVGSGKLLDDESKKEMQRTQSISRTPEGRAEEYGLGLDIVFVDKHRLFGHSGGFPGQITDTLCDPKNEIVVTALINCIDPGSPIVEGIYSVLYQFLENEQPDNKSNLTRFEDDFVNMWSAMRPVIFKDKVLATNIRAWKPFEGCEQLETINSSSLKITRATMASDRGEMVVMQADGTLKYGGATMWPEKEYLKRLKDKKVIGLPRG